MKKTVVQKMMGKYKWDLDNPTHRGEELVFHDKKNPKVTFVIAKKDITHPDDRKKYHLI